MRAPVVPVKRSLPSQVLPTLRIPPPAESIMGSDPITSQPLHAGAGAVEDFAMAAAEFDGDTAVFQGHFDG